MKKYLIKSEPFLKAEEETKGKNIIVQIFIFIVLIILSSIAQSFLIMKPVSIYLGINFEDLYSSGIMSSENIVILSLYATISGIIASIIYCRLFEKRSLFSMGFIKKNMFKEYGIGLIIGLIMISIPALVSIFTGAMTIDSFNKEFSGNIFLLFLVGFMIQGISEEILLRSYLFVSISIKSGIILGIIVNSLLFSLMHFANAGITVLSIINLILFGVFASVYFLKRGSIWGIGAIHSMWNFAMGNIYGIEVSGMKISNSLFKTSIDSTKSFINGGSFGFEGGIVATIVLLVGIILIILFGDYKKTDYN